MLFRDLGTLGQGQDPSTFSRAQDAVNTQVIALWERTPGFPMKADAMARWTTELQIFEGLWETELQRTEGVRPQLGCVVSGQANNCEPQFLHRWGVILCIVYSDAEICAPRSVFRA